MPQRLHRIFPLRSPECTRCGKTTGTYLHKFWGCPVVARFWREVVELINHHLELALPTNPELFLGIQEDEQRTRCTKILISYLFYYAKREIILKWNSFLPPCIASWGKSINAALPMFGLTYISRNCPKKFERVWQPWTA